MDNNKKVKLKIIFKNKKSDKKLMKIYRMLMILAQWLYLIMGNNKIIKIIIAMKKINNNKFKISQMNRKITKNYKTNNN